jgi:hypothetical protein
MRIIVVGCWRSGTTALFNMIRLICEADGPTIAFFEQTEKTAFRVFKHQVLKAHKYNEQNIAWADYVPQGHALTLQFPYIITNRKLVFTTHRDAGDILESMQRFRAAGGIGNGADPANLGRGLEHWGLYQQHACYMTWFNQFKRSPEKLIREITAILDLQHIDQKAVLKQWQALRPPKQGIDPLTLLHANHITQ